MELKIKCQCGVKYALDITPEHVANPPRFVCQYCGVDSSATVNQIIQQQFAESANTEAATVRIPATPTPPPAATPATPANPIHASPITVQSVPALPVARPAPAIPAIAATNPAPPSPPQTARLKVQGHTPEAADAAPSGAPASAPCLKHPGNFGIDECVVCHKPICPKCMELFGYLCSAYCAGQAEKLKLDVPVFEGQKSRVEAKHWKKVRLVSAAVVVLILALLSGYIWYYFVGSRPRLLYSIKFPPSENGNFAKLMGEQEALLRRGNQLSRYDLRADKAIWSVPLVDKEQVDKAVKEALARQKAQLAEWKIRRAKLKAAGRLNEDDSDMVEKEQSEADQLQETSKWVERDLASRVQLRVEDRNIWVITAAKAIQYAWDSGKPEKEVPIPEGLSRVLPGPDKSVLLVSQMEKGRETLTRLELASGEVKTEKLAGPEVPAAKRGKLAAAAVPATGTNRNRFKGAQLRTGASDSMAAAAAAVKAAPRRAAPMDMDDDSSGGFSGDFSAPVDVPHTGTYMVYAGENVAQLEVKLVQKNFVQYKAIKDKPKVSELDKGVNAANSVAAMSELMNEIQADRTGGMRTEDESKYLVTIKRRLASGVPDWSGEVVGPAALFSLKTVDVLTAGKAMYVFDKSNKKIWESKLAFPVAAGMLAGHEWFEDSHFNRSPCIERDQTLYFFDQGVLTAFELASGTVRWRLTSVGISAIHFDDKGNLYVSTSSAGAEALKYTDQIDLSKRVVSVIMKVDPRTGKTLWRLNKSGSEIYSSGKFLYTIEDVPAGGMRIYRLNPRNGEPMWEHYEKRYTRDCSFQQNTIQLLFDNELQVLRFMAL
jgi:hypothetical protein